MKKMILTIAFGLFFSHQTSAEELASCDDLTDIANDLEKLRTEFNKIQVSEDDKNDYFPADIATDLEDIAAAEKDSPLTKPVRILAGA